jgi:flagellar basal body rod protein FlgB
MFQLDDQFLMDIGLADLPDDQKKPFLQHVYDQLEYRVGVRLSEGMTDTQLEQFEAIIDRNEVVVNNWIQANAPGYAAEEVFQKIQTTSGLAADNPALKAEYAATKWLEVNRPDYRDVVALTLDELKTEINQNKSAILNPEEATGDPQPTAGANDQPAA